MYDHTIVVATWRDIPADVRGDCMAKLAPGSYGHLRLGIMFVCLDEANTTSAISALVQEVQARIISRDCRQSDACFCDECKARGLEGVTLR